MKQNLIPESLAPCYDMVARFKRCMFDRKYPLASQHGLTPFFIVGSGRCGSTLLRRMLQASPEVHIPPETYVLGEVCRLFMRNRQMDWHHLVNLVLSTFEYNREFERFEMTTRELVQQLWQLPEKERSLAAILDAFYRFHGQKTAQTFTMWGDKTPQNTLEMDIIIRTFPQAKFIHLLRDGVDVAASFVQRGLIPDVSTAAKHWQESVLTSRAFMKKYRAQCYEIRYEDLVASPVQSLQQLCDFLGIVFHDDMVGSLQHTSQMGDLNAYEHYAKVLEPVSAKNIGLGKADLSEEDLAVIHQHIGSTLKDMGYV